MNGVDAIAFTAGIGENDGKIRAKICQYLGYLGITLDEEANKARGKEAIITTKDSRVPVYAIPTNEELAIARETVALVVQNDMKRQLLCFFDKNYKNYVDKVFVNMYNS